MIEGIEIWVTAENAHNERVARVENQIIARLASRVRWIPQGRIRLVPRLCDPRVFVDRNSLVVLGKENTLILFPFIFIQYTSFPPLISHSHLEWKTPDFALHVARGPSCT